MIFYLFEGDQGQTQINCKIQFSCESLSDYFYIFYLISQSSLYYRIIVVRKCKWSDESKWLYFFLLINQKQSCFNAYLFVLKIVP